MVGKPEQVGEVVTRALTTSCVSSEKASSNDPVVSDELLAFVVELFARFNADYGPVWSSRFEGDVEDSDALMKMALTEWASKLIGCSRKQINRAYDKLDGLSEYVRFPPSARAFGALCRGVRRVDDERKRFLVRREQRLLPRPKPSPEALAERRKKIAEALGRPLSLGGCSEGGE